MTFFGRQVLAIGTAVLLLIVQVFPSLAVCVCGNDGLGTCCFPRTADMRTPDGGTCCTGGAKVPSAGCGGASDAGAPNSCGLEVARAGSVSDASVSDAGCRTVDLGATLTSLETPQAPEAAPATADFLPVTVEQRKLPVLDPRYPYHGERGPPLEPPAPVFLFHCSFLL